MRVYLLNPPFLPYFVRCGRWQGVTARGGTLDYPKWLAYTTGLLEKNGHDVQLRDAVASKFSPNDVINDVNEFQPDIIVAETNFSSLRNDLNVISEIKKRANKQIFSIIAGPPTAVYPEEILLDESIDAIARFEYDFVIADALEMLHNHQSLKGVKGVWYKENGSIIKNADRPLSTSEELDSLPFVSKIYQKYLNIHDYYLSQSLYPEVQIFTGRGCPYLCAFCSWPENLMGRKVRFRSVENIIQEFEYISKEIPFIREVFIEDDTFTLKKDRVQSFCHGLLHRGIKITWSCNVRADLDFETLRLMKKAGCRLIIVGYESGSDEILKSINKGITVEQAKEFTKNAKKAGLLVHGDFIIGLPGETESTAQKTYDYIFDLKPDILQVAVATPIPGTAFYNYVKNNGYLLIDDMSESIDRDGYQKCIVSYPDFSKEKIEHWVGKILTGYYFNPGYFFTFLNGCIRGGGIEYMKCVVKSGIDFIYYIKKGVP